MPLCVSMPPPSVISVPLAAVVLIHSLHRGAERVQRSGRRAAGRSELSWKAPLTPSKEKACPEMPGA